MKVLIEAISTVPDAKGTYAILASQDITKLADQAKAIADLKAANPGLKYRKHYHYHDPPFAPCRVEDI